MTLDSILNVVIPAGIFIGILIFIYSKAKEPLDNFFRMIKGWFQKMGSGDDEGETETGEEPLNYRIDYRGAEY